MHSAKTVPGNFWDVSGKYCCDRDGNVHVSDYVIKVNDNPQSSGATDDGDATVPEMY